MRPLRIEFQAFGPYAGQESVDFEKLSSQGVFLICGNTGSGKTMLLDAMTFALYGDSSGHGSGREKFENMRCTLADPETPTYVRFDFENQGQYYRFERKYAKKRKNYSTSCMAARKNDNGEWEMLFENPKEMVLNREAERIIGLNYDQFRQVIVLPQGQFEKLLTSKSDEKEKILTKIFRTEKWGRIAEIFYRKAEERKSALDEIKKEIDILLQEEGCQSTEELGELIASREKELEKLESTFGETGIPEKVKSLREILELSDRLHREEESLAEKQRERSMRDQWEEQLQKALRAEELRAPVDELRRVSEEKTAKEEEKQNLEKKAEQAGKEYNTAQSELKEHLSGEEEIRKSENRKYELELKRETYEKIDAVREEYESQKCRVKEAEEEVENSRKKLEQTEAERRRSEEEFSQAGDRYKHLIDVYVSGQIYEIRDRLEVNKPCPVCGVIVDNNHYQRVKEEIDKTDDDEHVTKEILDREKESFDEKDLAVKEAENRWKDQQEIYTGNQEVLSERQRELAALDERYKNMKSGLVEGIESLAELDKEMESCIEKAERYRDRQKQLEEQEKEAHEKSLRVNTQKDECEKELHNQTKKLREAERELEEAVKASIFTDRKEAEGALLDQETRMRLRNDVTAYDTEVKSLEERCLQIHKELEEKGNPDEEECREQLTSAEDEWENYKKEYHELDREIDKLKAKEEEIRKKREGVGDALARAEENLTFARQLRGDTGIGLHRYVLGIMLSDVVGAANRMLEKVHGGRYRLYRADDRVQGSYKKGLDLKVHDSYSGESDGRFVGTLSGGEKFLASLALAIGMSAVAQKNGIKIEALFIDEGFGSLDEDSIEDAMDILKGLQKTSGMVGIISHVKLMQDSISTKVIVKTGEDGSHIHTSIG